MPTCRRYIHPLVVSQLAVEPKIYLSRVRFSGVRGPQFGECLARRMYDVLNHARSDWQAIGGQTPVPVPSGKNLEDTDWIFVVGQAGVGLVGVAEVTPYLPGSEGGLGVFGGDTSGNLHGQSAEITLELVGGRLW